MKQHRFLRPIAPALLLAACASPAFAQTGFVPAPNPEADRLAQEMRVLAGDPRDVRALLEAGNLSARLGDTAAALAFFARAESIDPTNPGILAGRGAALVRMERPGEALRLFQAAEAGGLPAREYAADRAFAYDLLGQPGLAQPDYKLALQGDHDDETVRRYALSLGISGDVDESMRLLDPLLRKSDRAAWRARAFVLAMNGDMPGAERIAASMMPGNMGHALAPFFRRLASLPAADRAFAVHFGQLSPSAVRLADARQAPRMPPSTAPTRPAQVAQASPRATRPPIAKPQRDRRSRQERSRDARDTASADRAAGPAPSVPVQTAAAGTPPGPPAVGRAQTPMVQPLPAPRADEIDSPIEESPVARREAPVVERNAIVAPGGRGPALASAGDTSRSDSALPVPASNTAAVAAETLPSAARPSTGAAIVASKPEPVPPGPARVGQEDSVLASIVGGITIPGEELQIVTATPVDLAPQPTPPAPKPEPAKPAAKPTPEAAKPATAKPEPKAKKPDPKASKPEPKPRVEPARIWVQVAGGANEAALPKAWKAVAAKAPGAFKGKSGWSAPLRATNRVLAGPFKTAAEAQAFVNTLRKSDVSAFVFTSEAGEKVTKLGD